MNSACLYCDYPLELASPSASAEAQCPECGESQNTAELHARERSLAPGHPRFSSWESAFRLGARMFVPPLAWRHIRSRFLVSAWTRRRALFDLLCAGLAAAVMIGVALLAVTSAVHGGGWSTAHMLYVLVPAVAVDFVHNPVSAIVLTPVGKAAAICMAVLIIRGVRLVHTSTLLSCIALLPILAMIDLVGPLLPGNASSPVARLVLWGTAVPTWVGLWVSAAEAARQAPAARRRCAAIAAAAISLALGVSLQYGWIQRFW